MDDVTSLTADYERWLGSRIPLVPADLARKHAEMRHDEHRFLRGTYYLWLLRAAEAVPDAFSRARVPQVGDLHVENLGTWRDADGVRRWGVNDLDELARGPWLLDLVRLAVSAILSPHLTVGGHDVCDTLLGAWYDAAPGPAVDLRDPDAAHLAPLRAEGPGRRSFLRRAQPAGARGQRPAARSRRRGGAGGRARLAADLARARGRDGVSRSPPQGRGRPGRRRLPARSRGQRLGDPTCVWAAGRHPAVPMPTADPAAYDLVSAAVRGPAGAARVRDWQVRDLAPDVVRIQLAGQPHRDTRRLLEAMAQAAAGVHGADPTAFAATREETVSEHDLRGLVATMSDVVRRDFRSHA